MEIIVAATMILLAFLLVIPRFFKPSLAKSEAPNSNKKNIPKGFGRYTKAEVSVHNKRTDCWVIIKNKVVLIGGNGNEFICNFVCSGVNVHDTACPPQVYDVTSYVEEHPGGDAILTNAGDDSTEGFYGPQHGTRVFDLIEDFCIGELVE